MILTICMLGAEYEYKAMTHSNVYRTNLLRLCLAIALPLWVCSCNDDGDPTEQETRKSAQEMITDIESAILSSGYYKGLSEGGKSSVQSDIDRIKTIVKNNTDINAAAATASDSKSGVQTTLLNALLSSQLCYLETLNILSEGGVKWDQEDEEGNNVLHLLLEKESLYSKHTTLAGEEIESTEFFKRLLAIIKKTTPLKELMKKKNSAGKTPLHIAVDKREGHVFVEALKGLDPDLMEASMKIIDKDENTPLHYPGLRKTFAKALSSELRSDCINLVNNKKENPLHCVINTGDQCTENVTKVLILDLSKDVVMTAISQRTVEDADRHRDTPLDKALRKGYFQTACFLLTRVALEELDEKALGAAFEALVAGIEKRFKSVLISAGKNALKELALKFKKAGIDIKALIDALLPMLKHMSDSQKGQENRQDEGSKKFCAEQAEKIAELNSFIESLKKINGPTGEK